MMQGRGINRAAGRQSHKKGTLETRVARSMKSGWKKVPASMTTTWSSPSLGTHSITRQGWGISRKDGMGINNAPTIAAACRRRTAVRNMWTTGGHPLVTGGTARWQATATATRPGTGKGRRQAVLYEGVQGVPPSCGQEKALMRNPSTWGDLLGAIITCVTGRQVWVAQTMKQGSAFSVEGNLAVVSRHYGDQFAMLSSVATPVHTGRVTWRPRRAT